MTEPNGVIAVTLGVSEAGQLVDVFLVKKSDEVEGPFG